MKGERGVAGEGRLVSVTMMLLYVHSLCIHPHLSLNDTLDTPSGT